jgi:hypothetical protein
VSIVEKMRKMSDFEDECPCPVCEFRRENAPPRNRSERRLYEKSLEVVMKKCQFAQRAFFVQYGSAGDEIVEE